MKLYGPSMRPIAQRDLMTLPASDGWIRADMARPPAAPPARRRSRPATFEGIASTGLPESLAGVAGVAVDLGSLRYSLPVPVRLNHGPRLGVADRLVLDRGHLLAFGTLDPDGDHFDYVSDRNSGGHSWFLSINVRSNGGGVTEFVEGPVEVNARIFPGPLFVTAKYELVEISLTLTPCDEGAVCVLTF